MSLQPNHERGAWFRLLIPSIADLIFIALLFSLSCGPFGVRLLNDAGIGWHIRNGEHILQTHVITRVDLFSSSMSGHPWYAWEWLYDIGIAAIHHWLGLNGVVFFTAFIIAATFSIVFRVVVNRGASLPMALTLLMLSLGAASIHFLARPHVLSWLLTVVWFCCLDSDATASSSDEFYPLLAYPLLMLFWTNVHGGFLVGLVLAGMYVLAEMFEVLKTRGTDQSLARAKLKRFAGIGLLSLVATLINPFGYRLYSHIYEYLTNRFLMDHIDEFLSPNFHGAGQQCFAAILLITLIALASKSQRLTPANLLIVVFAAYSGLYSSRNLPVASILLTMIVSPMLTTTIARATRNEAVTPWLRRLFCRLDSFSRRMNSMEIGFRWHFPAALAFALGLAVCIHGGRVGTQQWMDARFSSKRFPVQAVENILLERQASKALMQVGASGATEPIFCPDYWGGYLVYRLYPRTKVVIDDRHDFYGEKILQQYLQTIRVGPQWNEMLDQQRVNWVLTPTQSSLTNVLKVSPQWEVSYEDGTSTLLRRVNK